MDAPTIMIGSVSCFFTLVLIGQFVYIARCFFSDMWLKNNGIFAKATVVDVRVVSDEDGWSYAPVLEYSVDGQTYRKYYSGLLRTFQNKSVSYYKGQEVEIRYDYKNPRKIVVGNGLSNGMGVFILIFGFFVTCLIGFGSAIFFFSAGFIQQLNSILYNDSDLEE